VGVPEILFMPDFFGIGVRAMEDLDVSLKISFLDMNMEGVQEDSTLAAGMLNDLGVGCIITLGGDGTNRAVAKACGETPILPISTGTNNVFPSMVEGTLAGIAAGVTAMHPSLADAMIRRAPRLEIRNNGTLLDMALVDVVVSKTGFIGSKAIWDVSVIKEIFLARAEPENIGFSSIGGLLCGIGPDSGQGVHLLIGEGGQAIRAPIAPGLVRRVPIKNYHLFEAGEKVSITHTPALIALDGEREMIVKEGEALCVILNRQGPRVVDIALALRKAAEQGLFKQ
jgi:predicted polyphosphate/ATP-dependent NAD kinase